MKLISQKIIFTSVCLFLAISSVKATVYTVNSLADAGGGTGTAGDLRYCINQANGAGGPHTINFSIAGTINLGSMLPSFQQNITIAGNTAPGYTTAPVVLINAASAGWCFLFNVAGGANSTIRALALCRAQFTNVEVNNVNNVTIQDCYIGTNLAGNAVAASNPNFGVRIYNGDNCDILNNVISGHQQHGVFVSDGSDDTVIRGNKIGTNALGNAAIPNLQHGILINTNCLRTIIGGTLTSERNLVSGNTHIGIQVWGGSNQPQIINNYVGVNNAGIAALANQEHGINIENSSSTTILNNVVSGNAQYGILIKNCNTHVVRGNYVGTNNTGTAAIPNVTYSGLSFEACTTITVGGTGVGEGNVLSGNGDVGLRFERSPNATVVGNRIGTNLAGAGVIANNVMGIFATNGCGNHQIGGSTVAARNLVSGNAKFGIQYNDGCNDLKIQGNYIGTDVNGGGAAATFGNGNSGIILSNNCLRALIGGPNTGERNVISGNGRLYPTESNGSGIFLVSGCSDAVIQGNIVGLQADGTTAMGNGENGIVIYLNCHNAIIGGNNATKRNIISSNGTKVADVGQGIVIDGSHNADIFGNYIGTDINGTLARGNAQSGVITIFSNGFKIGHAVANEGNIISNGGELGIHIVGGNGGTIYNNKIGVSATNAAMGNRNGGVFIHGVAAGTNGSDILVGGTAALQSNVIAYSTGTGTKPQFGNGFGVGVAHNDEGKRNSIVGNSIYCNAGQGIDLNFSGAFGGPGVNGIGNNGKSAPTVNASIANTISGTGVNGDAIHIYRNTTSGGGCGCEGEIYLGTTNVSGGTWSFTHSLGLSTADALLVSATARDAVNNTSQFVCNIPLPVELTYFNVEKINETGYLTWSTASETNNDYFMIEKSTDGINFVSIGIVEGKGTFSGTSYYSFSDPNLAEGINYYRLVQQDFDGTKHFSEIKTIVKGTSTEVMIYPNPFSDEIKVAIFGEEVPEFSLYDVIGQEIFTNRKFNASGNVYTLELKDLTEGVYWLGVKIATNSKNYKIVKK